MKTDRKLSNLKYLILGAGGLGFFLQRMQYRTGIDEKGLLIPGHWTRIALMALTVLVLFFLYASTRTLPPLKNTPAKASVSGGIGCLLGAAALFIRLPEPPMGPDRLCLLEHNFAIAAQLILCILAFCRFTGRKPSFLLHGILCLYLALRTVGQYRLWSSVPQLADYACFLLAHVALMISTYQLAARDAGSGDPKKLWRWGLTALYLCCSCSCGRNDRIFLLLFGIWLFISLPASQPEEPQTIPNDIQEVTP